MAEDEKIVQSQQTVCGVRTNTATMSEPKAEPPVPFIDKMRPMKTYRPFLPDRMNQRLNSPKICSDPGVSELKQICTEKIVLSARD